MKRMIRDIMALTGITLVILSVVALFYNATMICISTVFQSLGLNILIYAGMELLERLEYRYPIVETGVKLIFVLTVVLVGGQIFGWYENLSVIVLIIMTIAIFLVCVGLDMFHLRDEVNGINALLENTRKNS